LHPQNREAPGSQARQQADGQSAAV
jgi:hypothetical protein